MDRSSEESLDHLARITCKLLGVPVAFVSRVEGERQRILGQQGLPEPWATRHEAPLEHFFGCRLAAKREPLVVEDLGRDPRRHEAFDAGGEETGGLKAGAFLGIPLLASGGELTGLLCAIDTEPRRWSEEELGTLADLAALATTELEARRPPRESAGGWEGLHDTDHWIHAILDAADAVIFVKDLEGRYRLTNRAMCLLFGRSREEILGRTDAEIFPPEMAAALVANDREVLRGGESQHFEEATEVVGERRVYISHKFPLRRADGEVYALAGISTDITPLKQAEEALRQSESTLRSFYESAPLLMGVVELPEDDADIIHIYDSPATDRFFGRPRGKTAGERASALGAPPEVIAAWIARYRASEREGRPIRFEYVHPTADGPVWLSCVVACIGPSTDGRTRFSYATEDITARKQAEEALRQSEERYRLSARATNDVIWDWDLTADRVTWNPAVSELFGWFDAEETTAAWWTERIHPEDLTHVLDSLDAVMESGREHWQAEYRFRCADGTYAYVLDRGSLLRGRDGEPLRMLGAMLDLTERKRAEIALRESEATLGAVLDALPVGVRIADAGGRIVRTNAANEQIWGAIPGAEDWKAYETWAGYWPETGERVAAREWALARALLEGEVVRGELVECERFDTGERRFILNNAAPIRDAAGQITAAVVAELDVTDRLMVERALRESEEKYRLLTEVSPQVVWITEPDGRLVYMNQWWIDYTGLSREESLGSRWAQAIHPDYREYVLTTWLDAAVRGESYHVEVPFRRADGEYRWHFGRGLPHRDESGNVVRWVGVAIDIHDRKLAEEALRKSEERLSLASNATQVVIWDWNVETDAVEWNENVGSVFGWTEIVGQPQKPSWWIERVHPDEREQVTGSFLSVVRDPARTYWRDEYRFRRKDGTYRHVVDYGYVVRDADGEAIRMTGAMLDVTERREAEEKLHLYATRFQALAEVSLAVTAAPGLERKLELITEAARQIIGAHQAQISLTTGDGRAQTINAVSLSDEYSAWGDDRALPDESGIYALACGTNRPVRMTRAELEAHPAWQDAGHHAADRPPIRGWLAAPLVGRDGGNIGLLQLFDRVDGAFTEDDELILVQLVQFASVSIEQAQAEAALKELNETLEHRVTERTQELERANRALQQRNRELQDFAYVASHDLQEPLRKIATFADLLQAESRDRLDEDGRTFLGRIQSAAQRMSSLITDLLAFSRVQTQGAAFRRVDLDEIVQEVLVDLEVAIREADATVEVGELGSIVADATQMRQLLQNLISNAVKFRRPGVPPVVRIGTRTEMAPRAEACGSWPVRILEVEDNGIGLEEKYVERIFAPFQRLHGRDEYPGTGMGLAICRRIVEQHGGEITARSRPGEGSTFVATFPIEHAGAVRSDDS